MGIKQKSQSDHHLLEAYRELVAIRDQVIHDGDNPPVALAHIHDDFQQSATNLLHYLSLRRHDLRELQHQLIELGLSSLGGSESCVLSSLNRVVAMLQKLLQSEIGDLETSSPLQNYELDNCPSYSMGQLTLNHHANTLLGARRDEQPVRIMVTMPSEAAQDYTLVHDLVQSGMDCVRINCAHDSPKEWAQMIAHLRRAETSLNRSCRIAMDLAGPKLRTGPIKSGAEVIKVKPKRNDFGWVTAHTRVWLSPVQNVSEAPSPADAQIQVDQSWLQRLQEQDNVVFRDARGAKRTWQVVDVTPAGAWLEGRDTAYITNGQLFTLERDKSTSLVTGVPAKEQSILLKMGDTLVVTRDAVEGTPSSYDSTGEVLTPARISCTLPECLSQVQQGEPIWFDDGKIGGIIEQVYPDKIVVKINRVRSQGRKLRADKGINLPESQLTIPALTEKDRQDLRFIAEHADIVSLSFVNDARDVEQLKGALVELGPNKPGIVLKIETRRGFINLPHLLLSVMSWPSCGVMIARGDLAVECGFERLAEVQEEILWLCEAAHVPVIWATQVLESLAKDGLPSRAEITDAAMAHRAECVMLNKGPHIDMAIHSLNDILQRMRRHQNKKRSMMQRLHVAMFE